MKIRFGYVSISKTLDITSSHTITYTNYLKLENKCDKLVELARMNLDNLRQILFYNIKNNIHFYRMSSNIFPLFSHPDVDIDYLKIFKSDLEEIGNIINKNRLRVDVHLDEYSVLNSTNNKVVKTAINIINFFKNMFKCMNIKSYMVIHVGSSVFGKKQGIHRFINNFLSLDEESKKLLIIENDDKIYNIVDVLNLCNLLNVPMVLDYHHYMCNHDEELIENYISDIFATWKNDIPKIHFSSPKNSKEKRSHHDYINVHDFIFFLEKIKFINKDFDVMIEAKEKDNALFNLVRLLKFYDINLLDETTCFFY